MLSDERQGHFAKLIVDGIWNDDLVEYSDEDAAMRVARRGVSLFVKEFAELDSKARATVASLKRNVPEGSPEWDVMYSKYLEEEMRRKGN